MCVKCEGTNNICSLICRAVPVISTGDESESVAAPEREREIRVIQKKLLLRVIFKRMCVLWNNQNSIFTKTWCVVPGGALTFW